MNRIVVLADRTLDVERVLAAGRVTVQVRDKGLDGGALLELARRWIAAGAETWVNDRVDVALAAGAIGVHLPERGMAIADARAVAATLLIGCSRHDRAGVLAAADADVVQLGPIWETPGKGPPLGVEALAVRAELAARVGLVAVGGIDRPERVRAALAAGANAVAVIRAARDPVLLAELLAAAN